jgi:alkylation response protein AidB-like acyl-CoA dehydrogenase
MAASTGDMADIARSFGPRIASVREQIEAERRIPDDLAKDLAQAGLFRIALPAAYGGLDRTPMEGLEVFETLAQADASVAWCVWNGNAYWTATQLSRESAEEIFADPGVIVANSTQPKGQATIVQGGYRVSGRWSLVSGCQISDWMQLMCIVYRDGKPRLTPAGTPQARFMFCRAADCEIVDTWNAGGLRGTGSHDVVVRDLFVPKRHGSFYADPPVLTNARYRLPSWTREIPGCGAIALGIARGAIEALVELGGAKRPERSSQLLSEDRGAQVRLAQAEALVSSARLLLFDAVSQLWEEILAGGEPTLGGRARVRLATSHAVASAVQAVDLAQLTGGASSVYSGSPLERAFRDVHAITQHIAVHPRVMESVGRALFGLDIDTLMF